MAGILQMPARVAAVAGVTFTQLLRMRLFLVPAVAAVLFLLLQFIPYQENISLEYQGVAQLQLIKDICMGCMQLFGLIFCVAATAMLIPKDSEDRILYTILCKPVPRFDYLLGKVLGVLILLVLMLGVMDGMMLLLLSVREAAICENLVAALTAAGYSPADMQPYLEQVSAADNTTDTQMGILVMLEGYAVLTGLTLLISCCTSGSIVSIIFGLGAYVVGMFQQTLLSMFQGGVGETPLMQWTERIISILLPDFSLFSMASAASAGVSVGWAMVGNLSLIMAGYMLLHVLTATWIFSRKEF